MPYEARPLDLLPGLFMESSDYAAQGRYVDGSNVRFWKGYPERIGGSSQLSTDRAYFPVRGINAWRSLADNQYTALGHARGVELLEGGTTTDISPTGDSGYPILALTIDTIASGSGTIGAGNIITNGTSGITAKVVTDISADGVLNITADDTATPAVLPTWVVTLTGSPATAFLSGEQVTFSGGATARHLETNGADLYLYDVSNGTQLSGTVTGDVSGASGTYSSRQESWPSSSTITDGTTSTTANVDSWEEAGNVNSGAVVLFGDGTFGTPVWGGDEGLYSTVDDATTWTFANWGEDLIACPRDGEIYVLDTSAYEADATTNLSKISNAPNALGIFLNSDNRTLIAYGADDDPLNIAWCDEGDYTVWTASASNTAGSVRCERGSVIIGRIPARGGHLISTDTAIYLMRYIGLPFVFSLNKVADQGGMIGPLAGAEQDSITYWMGTDGFYVYDGTVQRLPCDLQQYVFGRLNLTQAHKVACGSLRAYNEIWWWYVSSDATDQEIDSYVAYNTVERTWHKGTKARTSWLDSSVVLSYPTACEPSGRVNAEEFGADDNGTAISYTLETSEVEVNDGTPFLHARKLIPDYHRITGTHTVTIKTRGYPQRTERTKGPYNITGSTEDIDVRSRGRMLRFLFEGDDDFRMGRWRYRVTAHGQKDG